MLHWYDVDMNNSKNKALYGKQMEIDIKKLYILMLEELKNPKKPKKPKK